MSTRLCIPLFAIGLSLAPPTTMAYGYLDGDNPFVEAMLRMMELFGFIDRDRLPLGVPFLPAAGPVGSWNPGLAGLGGMPGLGAWGGMPGPGSMTGLPGLGGGPLSVLGGMPGSIPWDAPGGPQWPGGSRSGPSPAADPRTSRIGLLDGIWETDKGAVVIIKADAARLYVSQDRYQDFIIRYDHDHFWWQPRDGSKFRRYRYEMREGRMILADGDNNLLLMRRRR